MAEDAASLKLDKLFEGGTLVRLPRLHKRLWKRKFLIWGLFLLGLFLLLQAG